MQGSDYPAIYSFQLQHLNSHSNRGLRELKGQIVEQKWKQQQPRKLIM